MMENPWLNIPAVDYEGHMDSPNVDQLSFLGSTFKKALENHDCDTVALLGCATGNGLEHVDPDVTRRITAVDINPEYLAILRQSYEGTVPGLEIVEADLETCAIGDQAYSLIFAGLVFEYLEPRKLLSQIAGWLQAGGVMVAVLQLPAKHENMISETSYASLKKLASIMKLIPPEELKIMAIGVGLLEIEAKTITLKSGKPFYVGTYMKGQTNERNRFK
jgi:SAM-dependent methyltransferase